MKNGPRKSPGNNNVDRWDGMNLMERLNLIMDHTELFISHWLITQSEIAMVSTMPESAKEYIVCREDQPMFTSIHLKKEVAAQNHRDKLEAALEAVFK